MNDWQKWFENMDKSSQFIQFTTKVQFEMEHKNILWTLAIKFCSGLFCLCDCGNDGEGVYELLALGCGDKVDKFELPHDPDVQSSDPEEVWFGRGAGGADHGA